VVALPQLGDFLNRFRPAGAPGAASRAGVPADRAAELWAELDPVLAMLAATDAECARLVAEAEREAGRIAAEARDQAAGIAADAERLADDARAAAAAEVLAAAREQAEQAERAAAADAAARPGPAEADVRALIEAAVELVRSMAERTGGR
jgi:hypothetical protein